MKTLQRPFFMRRVPVLPCGKTALHAEYCLRRHEMPDFAATLFLGDVEGSYGWSETYYLTAVTDLVARDKLDDLCNARINVLVDVCKVESGRVSNVDIVGDSFLSTVTPLTGLIVSTHLTAVDPWSALNLRLEAGSLHRGRKFMHGVLEDTFDSDRRYNPGNPNAGAWTTWLAFLVADWKIRVGPAPAFTYEVITAALPIREVEHKVGRPFTVLRGRR